MKKELWLVEWSELLLVMKSGQWLVVQWVLALVNMLASDSVTLSVSK